MYIRIKNKLNGRFYDIHTHKVKQIVKFINCPNIRPRPATRGDNDIILCIYATRCTGPRSLSVKCGSYDTSSRLCVIIYTKAFTTNKTNDNKTDLPVFVLAF